MSFKLSVRWTAMVLMEWLSSVEVELVQLEISDRAQ
jgi:hypothetical protein